MKAIVRAIVGILDIVLLMAGLIIFLFSDIQEPGKTQLLIAIVGSLIMLKLKYIENKLK